MQQPFDKYLFNNYNLYLENSIKTRRFKYKQYYQFIEKIKKKSNFDISVAGKSFEEREIFQIKLGIGKIKILLWSQMHGNESVATLAILDILNFFKEKNNEQTKILENCTLYFVPLLNPDGAELFQRRNAQCIDLNRDAIKQTAPESKILMKIIAQIKPDFGFNLHDQDLYYGVANTKKRTTLSFLAPAYNFKKEINESREKSMQVIISMYNMLQNYIPRQIAKYSDAYMPNAFGDNIQKKGTSTILIESGYFQNDTERQFVRKLNFISIIYAFFSIVTTNYSNNKISDYEKIPQNKKDAFFDYLLKNITLQRNNKKYTVDIGISRDKTNNEEFTDYKSNYYFYDIGDLSSYNGFKEINFDKKIINYNKNKIQKFARADWLIKELKIKNK